MEYNVALRKESVDRNSTCSVSWSALIASLSARRAWIEISRAAPPGPEPPVALRKESVDRNSAAALEAAALLASLSARRAWIEILRRIINSTGYIWSLSARRAWIEIKFAMDASSVTIGRSPQGERG